MNYDYEFDNKYWVSNNEDAPCVVDDTLPCYADCRDCEYFYTCFDEVLPDDEPDAYNRNPDMMALNP